MKLVLIAAAIAAMSTLNVKNNLVGRWESRPSEKGNITGVVFKSDSTYMAYINRKPFTSGVYTLTDGRLSIKEPGCDTGMYKLIFFASGDSLRFQPVTDTCIERARGMSRLILGRVNRGL